MGRRLQQGDRRQDQLPVGRLGRRHEADPRQDRRFRRLGCAAEGRGTGQGRPAAVSDRDRRRRSGGQHQGHRPGPDEAERPGARRHLPRQDHQVERSGADRAESRASRCRMRPSPWCAAPTVRAPASSSPTTCRRSMPSGRARSAKVRRSSGRPAPAARATKVSRPSCTRLPNSIGYVEYAYVKQNKMTYACCRTRPAISSRPDDANFKAAAAGADWNKSFYQILTNQPGKDAWPLTGATFIMMHKAQDKPEQAHAVAEVLRLGLWQRRRDGGRTRLRAAAGFGQGAGAQAVGPDQGRRAARSSRSSKKIRHVGRLRRLDLGRAAGEGGPAVVRSEDSWPLHFPLDLYDDKAIVRTPDQRRPTQAAQVETVRRPRLLGAVAWCGNPDADCCWPAIIVSLVIGAWPAIAEYGLSFLWQQRSGIRCRTSTVAW